MFLPISWHSDPTVDGAAGPVPGDMNRARGQHKWALCDFHGPGTPAEPSACVALGIAPILFTSGTKIITTMGMHMPVTHVSYLQFRSLQHR